MDNLSTVVKRLPTKMPIYRSNVMPKTYARLSAEVLNEADAFERRLNYSLFLADQDARLWGPSSIDWTPGRPIYIDPETLQWLRADPEMDPEFYEWAGPRGNCVRYMAQIITSYEPPMDCENCDVSGDPLETECWFCGAAYQTSWRKLFVDYQPLVYTEVWNRLNAHVVAAAEQLTQIFRGVSVQFQILDEAILYKNEQPAPVTDYVRPGSGYIANPNRDVFTAPDVVGPVWGPAAFFEPRTPFSEIWLEIPPDWTQRSTPVVLPNIPEIDWSKRPQRGDNYRNYSNQIVAEMRRTRR